MVKGNSFFMCFLSQRNWRAGAEAKISIIAKVYVYNLTDGKVEIDVNLSNKKAQHLTKLMTRKAHSNAK